MKDTNNDSVKELIPRYLAGDVSPEEQRQLQDWIDKSPENERLYVDSKRLFELSEKHYKETVRAQDLPINVDHEWNHFITTLSKKEETPSRSLEPSTRPTVWYKIAATLLLIAASGFVINYFLSKPGDLHYQTAGNTLDISLPDGSRVTLNRYSELSYTSTFGDDDRGVTLKGEAFFDVVHDTQKPFIIKINTALVEVVGTTFNVRGYDENKTVEVIVKTGVVKLLVPTSNTHVKLSAGDKGVYSTENKNIDSSINKDINFLAWNTKQIVFEESDLQTVAETLNKAYGVTIVLATEIPSSCVVTVTFDHQSLEAVLHVLETTLNLTYKVTGNQIEITNAGC